MYVCDCICLYVCLCVYEEEEDKEEKMERILLLNPLFHFFIFNTRTGNPQRSC